MYIYISLTSKPNYFESWQAVSDDRARVFWLLWSRVSGGPDNHLNIRIPALGIWGLLRKPQPKPLKETLKELPPPKPWRTLNPKPSILESISGASRKLYKTTDWPFQQLPKA